MRYFEWFYSAEVPIFYTLLMFISLIQLIWFVFVCMSACQSACLSVCGVRGACVRACAYECYLVLVFHLRTGLVQNLCSQHTKAFVRMQRDTRPEALSQTDMKAGMSRSIFCLCCCAKQQIDTVEDAMKSLRNERDA